MPASTRWSSSTSPIGRSTSRARRRYSRASNRPCNRSGPSRGPRPAVVSRSRPTSTASPALVRITARCGPGAVDALPLGISRAPAVHAQVQVGAATVVGVDQQVLSARLHRRDGRPRKRPGEHLGPDQRPQAAGGAFERVSLGHPVSLCGRWIHLASGHRMSPQHRIDPLAMAFAGAAERYELGRPEYPDEPVEWVYAQLGLDASSQVVDLAAGTGKLSRVLARRPGRLVAIEPLAQMRAVLVRQVPGIDARDGTAEHLPLEASSADAVFVGEAFHWFDQARALPEIHRVLRPGGALVLVYGSSDWDHLPWNEAVEQRLKQVDRPHVTPQNRPWTGLWREPLQASPLFGEIETQVFANPREYTVESLLRLMSTWSFVAAMDEPEQAALLADLETLMRPEGPDRFELPGTVTLYVAKAANA